MSLVGTHQCDQILQNFATLGNVYKSLAIFDCLFRILQTAETTLANL